MTARHLPLATVCALALLAAACAAPTTAPSTGGTFTSPLSNIVTPEDAAANAALDKQVQLSFPVRVGIAELDYETGLKAEDRQNVYSGFKDALDATGLVSDTIQLPDSLTSRANSAQALRQVAAQFKADVLLLVSGQTTQAKADDQPVGFFDSWGGKAYWEARTQIVAVSMDVRTGVYLAPFQTVGVDGPGLMVGGSSAFYQQRQKAETSAWSKLRTDAVSSLKKLKTLVDAANAGASPAPTPAGSGSPAASASPSATPTPAGTGSPEADASPTASPSGSPDAGASPTASPTASPSATASPS